MDLWIYCRCGIVDYSSSRALCGVLRFERDGEVDGVGHGGWCGEE